MNHGFYVYNSTAGTITFTVVTATDLNNNSGATQRHHYREHQARPHRHAHLRDDDRGSAGQQRDQRHGGRTRARCR